MNASKTSQLLESIDATLRDFGADIPPKEKPKEDAEPRQRRFRVLPS